MIMGIIMAVAYPVVKTARRNAKKGEISANLKAILDARLAYCSANNIQPAACNGFGSSVLVPTYLPKWPGNSIDTYDATPNGYDGATYRSVYTYKDMQDATTADAAVTAAGY